MSFTANHLMQSIKNAKGFDKLMQKLKIIKLENTGRLLAELKVEQEHSNAMGGLHGGFSATLVDQVSSYALLAHDKGCVPSVSVDIHMTYCQGAKIGEDILIEAKTLRAGKKLAFLEVEITNKETGNLLVKATHTKYLLQNN